jgi:dihydrodipicolinate synthase/N-acetylneuraminate lyase
MTADFVTEIAHAVPNIVGMKDTSGDITLTEEFIRSMLPETSRVHVKHSLS